MSNVTRIPLQNAYTTTLSSSINSTVTSLTVDDAPDFTLPVGQSFYIVVDPKNSFREVMLVTAVSSATFTVQRGKTDYDGGTSTAVAHSGGAKVVITNTYHIFDEYGDAINSKLDNDGGNTTTTFDLDLNGSNFRIRKDGNNMKFTDDNQAEVTLSTLAAGAGSNDKVKGSSTDSAADYLIAKVSTKHGIDIGGRRRQVLTFDSGGDAGVTYGGGAYNTTDFIKGNASRGYTNTAGTQIVTMSWAVNIDWTDFGDGGAASTTNDYISLWVYIGGTLPTNIQAEFSTSNAGTDVDVNEFQVIWSASTSDFIAGWNLLRVRKSAFVTTGTVNWNSLGYFRLYYEGGDGTTDVYYDNLELVESSDKLGVNLLGPNVIAGKLANICSDVSATEAEIDQALDGISANVTATNLNTLTAGSSSDASSLHKHGATTMAYTAYETITTDDAVALLPIEVEYYAQLDDESAGADIALGDANTRRKYAIKVTPSQAVATMPELIFRTRKVGSGVSMIVRIETDNSGEPSGTLVNANATSTIGIPAAVTYGNDETTWAGAFALVANTDYWIVIQVATTDAANYNQIAVNSSFDENYLTFERLTYNLDAGTWGGSVTNATPYFWCKTNLRALGMALCPTDANFGGRTWNFVGFAKAGGAAGISIDVYTKNVPDLSGLSLDSDYYLSTTAGGITTSQNIALYANGIGPSTYSYKIGKALSATDLKIDLGSKKIFIHEVTGLSATTTRQYITWFKPSYVRISGTVHVTNNDGISNGVFLPDNSDTCVWMTSSNAGSGSGGAGGSVSESLYMAIGGNGFTGAGSGVTVAGFTYVYTKTGTAAVCSMLECSD